MAEFGALLCLAGLFLSLNPRLGRLNPFQIYFLLWFLVLFGFILLRDTFVPISDDLLLLLLTAKCFSLVLLITVHLGARSERAPPLLPRGALNRRALLVAQVIVLLVAPLVYFRTQQMAGGANLFSVLGYIKLRSAMTQDGDGYGLLGYFSVLSYVVGSISVLLYMRGEIGTSRLLLSVGVSFLYVYLATGRTSVLLFALLTFIPMISWRMIGTRGIACVLALVMILFIFSATLTAKGISAERELLENVFSFLENLRAYTIAPLLALSNLVSDDLDSAFGGNTFRTLFAVLYKLGMTDSPPVALIREFTFVPDATNVYTVYEAYLSDFSYLGMIVPPMFLVLHWYLYQKANRFGGVWVFYYAASVYPLVMQFFQDQYVALLSQWVQIAFWYWLLLSTAGQERIGWANRG